MGTNPWLCSPTSWGQQGSSSEQHLPPASPPAAAPPSAALLGGSGGSGASSGDGDSRVMSCANLGRREKGVSRHHYTEERGGEGKGMREVG